MRAHSADAPSFDFKNRPSVSSVAVPRSPVPSFTAAFSGRLATTTCSTIAINPRRRACDIKTDDIWAYQDLEPNASSVASDSMSSNQLSAQPAMSDDAQASLSVPERTASGSLFGEVVEEDEIVRDSVTRGVSPALPPPRPLDAARAAAGSQNTNVAPSTLRRSSGGRRGSGGSGVSSGGRKTS